MINVVADQIEELNERVKIRLAPSKIAGIGVVALRDIGKGEKLYCMPEDKPKKFYKVPYSQFKRLRPEVKDLILERWASVIHGSHFTSPMDDQWLILFINHSDDPNYNPRTDRAMKEIKKGEEVVSDYRTMSGAEEIYTFLKDEPKR